MTVKVKFDPGHGGDDPGAVGNGLREKDLTLAIALAAEKHLNDNYDGVEVRLTRRGDSTLSLPARTNQAINWGADSLVSIHINSAGNAAATGYEDFRHTTQSATSPSGRLQSAIHSKVSPLFPRDRGKKQANYHMVREATVRPAGQRSIPSTLTECGFIVNVADAALLKDRNFINRLGVAHAEGIAAFHGLKRKQVAAPSAPSAQNGIGRVTIQAASLNLRDKPALDGKVIRVLSKGESYNVYEVRGNWYRLSATGWASIGSGGNLMTYKAHQKPAPAPPKPPIVSKPTGSRLNVYRVKVDGKQVGAYGNPKNALEEVEKAIKAGKKNVELERV